MIHEKKVALSRRLVGTREAAAYLGIHSHTLRDLAARGEIKCIRMPRGDGRIGAWSRYMFDKQDLDRFIERLKN